jgi:hypothetical protein
MIRFTSYQVGSEAIAAATERTSLRNLRQGRLALMTITTTVQAQLQAVYDILNQKSIFRTNMVEIRDHKGTILLTERSPHEDIVTAAAK